MATWHKAGLSVFFFLSLMLLTAGAHAQSSVPPKEGCPPGYFLMENGRCAILAMAPEQAPAQAPDWICPDGMYRMGNSCAATCNRNTHIAIGSPNGPFCMSRNTPGVSVIPKYSCPSGEKAIVTKEGKIVGCQGMLGKAPFAPISSPLLQELAVYADYVLPPAISNYLRENGGEMLSTMREVNDQINPPIVKEVGREVSKQMQNGFKEGQKQLHNGVNYASGGLNEIGKSFENAQIKVQQGQFPGEEILTIGKHALGPVVWVDDALKLMGSAGIFPGDIKERQLYEKLDKLYKSYEGELQGRTFEERLRILAIREQNVQWEIDQYKKKNGRVPPLLSTYPRDNFRAFLPQQIKGLTSVRKELGTCSGGSNAGCVTTVKSIVVKEFSEKARWLTQQAGDLARAGKSAGDVNKQNKEIVNGAIEALAFLASPPVALAKWLVPALNAEQKTWKNSAKPDCANGPALWMGPVKGWQCSGIMGGGATVAHASGGGHSGPPPSSGSVGMTSDEIGAMNIDAQSARKACDPKTHFQIKDGPCIFKSKTNTYQKVDNPRLKYKGVRYCPNPKNYQKPYTEKAIGYYLTKQKVCKD